MPSFQIVITINLNILNVKGLTFDILSFHCLRLCSCIQSKKLMLSIMSHRWIAPQLCDASVTHTRRILYLPISGDHWILGCFKIYTNLWLCKTNLNLYKSNNANFLQFTFSVLFAKKIRKHVWTNKGAIIDMVLYLYDNVKHILLYILNKNSYLVIFMY